MTEPTLQRTDFYDAGTTTTETLDNAEWTISQCDPPVLRVSQVEPQSCLHLVAGFEVAFAKPMPCRWWRFWQWLLLGWRWEAVSDD